MKNKLTYLNKSIKLYKIYGFGLLLVLFDILVLKPLFSEYNFITDLLIGLPILIMIFLAPIGLFFCWKSYRNKETSSNILFKYTIGHLFFTLFSLFFIIITCKEIIETLNKY